MRAPSGLKVYSCNCWLCPRNAIGSPEPSAGQIQQPVHKDISLLAPQLFAAALLNTPYPQHDVQCLTVGHDVSRQVARLQPVAAPPWLNRY